MDMYVDVVSVSHNILIVIISHCLLSCACNEHKSVESSLCMFKC